jgi:hypothetical protein
MKRIRSDRDAQWFIVALRVAIAVGMASLSAFPTPSSAQTAAATTAAASAATTEELKCTVAAPPPKPAPLNGQKDPFKGSLVGPNLPVGLLPIDGTVRNSILDLGLPCQEDVGTTGQEDVQLDNLQRGFDFYSWRTFIALNSPAGRTTSILQAKADTPTRWEGMANFKQLLDVMLPAKLQPPSWPTDSAGMNAERERLMPPECSVVIDHHAEMRDRMIVKMIEESYNEPFKTGPLIDQQGHYAIFDILMNRKMFDYITDKIHPLYSQALQAADSDLSVDFPAGNDAEGDLGAFMLKVSWKILSDKEIADNNFHMVKALVLTPPVPNAERKCLPETLGLIGFHAVHKTVTRPQWIWTSFEHVKNVPERDEVAANTLDGPYNFFNVDCKTCALNATPPRPWAPVPKLNLSFRGDDSFKSQIVREVPLTNAAKNMNKIFQNMLADTVWKNYMLISTQWPSAFGCTKLHSNSSTPKPQTDFLKQPDMTCSPAPTFLANSTLETYSQGNIPLASSSCIACHGNAVDFQRGASNPQAGKVRLNESDFTFILEKAQ